MSRTAHVKTPSGFEADVSLDRLDDYELTELLCEYVGGKGLVLPQIVAHVLDPEDVKRMKDHLRGDDGRVTTDAVSAELLEIIKAARKN